MFSHFLQDRYLNLNSEGTLRVRYKYTLALAPGRGGRPSKLHQASSQLSSRCCKRGRGMQKHERVVGCCLENIGCGGAARTVLLARCFNDQARQCSLLYLHITASPALRWEGGTRSGGQLRRHAGRARPPPPQAVFGPSAPAGPGSTRPRQAGAGRARCVRVDRTGHRLTEAGNQRP